MDDLDKHLTKLDYALMSMGRQYAAEMSGAPLTGPQFMMMRVIKEMGPVNPSVLAQSFGVSMSAITAAVKRMERDGLVTRSEDQENRRYVVIEITPLGLELLSQSEVNRRTLMRKMFGKLSSVELETLTTLMSKIADT